MKYFLYSHPILAKTLFAISFMLPFLGFLIPLVLMCCGIDINDGLLLALMLGGLLLALLVLFIPIGRKAEETLNELCQLKRDRKAFHAPKPHLTVENAKAYIAQNLEKRTFTKPHCKTYHTETVSCVGIWMNEATIRANCNARQFTLPTICFMQPIN